MGTIKQNLHIGKTYMMLSKQGWVLAVCNTIIFIVVVLSMLSVKQETEQGSKTKALIKNVVALVFFFIVMVLQVYSLNCMITGDCHVWAWILASFAVITTLLYMLAFVFIIFKANKKSPASSEKA